MADTSNKGPAPPDTQSLEMEFGPTTQYYGFNVGFLPAWLPSLRTDNFLPSFIASIDDDFQNRICNIHCSLDDVVFLAGNCLFTLKNTFLVAERLKEGKIALASGKEATLNRLDEILKDLEYCRTTLREKAISVDTERPAPEKSEQST